MLPSMTPDAARSKLNQTENVYKSRRIFAHTYTHGLSVGTSRVRNFVFS